MLSNKTITEALSRFTGKPLGPVQLLSHDALNDERLRVLLTVLHQRLALHGGTEALTAKIDSMRRLADGIERCMRGGERIILLHLSGESKYLRCYYSPDREEVLGVDDLPDSIGEELARRAAPREQVPTKPPRSCDRGGGLRRRGED